MNTASEATQPEVQQAAMDASDEAAAAPVEQAAEIPQLPAAQGEEAAPAAASRAGQKRWYIIHAHSGFEKKVAQGIKEKAAQEGLSDKFEEVTVPVEDVVEVRRGKKVAAERKFFPGYVLVKMEMTDAAWQLVRNIPKVTGFLGGRGIRPQPISEAEAESIFRQVKEGVDSPKHSVHYDIGEQVKVIDGPFESFVGVVEEVDEEKSKLKVSVSIFGRATPVELEFDQVQRI